MWTGSLCLFMFALLATFNPVNGYASWLKCYVDLDANEVIMNRHVNEVDNSPHLVTVKVRLEGTEEWLDNLTFPSDSPTTVDVRLAVPPALMEEDVQFVMETTDGAKFAPPAMMCEGRRSFSRAYDEHVTLVLDGTTPTVSLKAGWAAGHEAVNLTPLLVLRKEPATVDEF